MFTSAVSRWSRGAAGLCALAVAGTALAAPPSCRAESSAASPAVVELYTSEGCSSCPPADRWLSSRAADPALVALAFHVDYWDRLGWKDRFADHAYTERQTRTQRTSGARFSYTPQVIVAGRDTPDGWDRSVDAAVGAGAGSPVAIEWRQASDPDRIVATVRARSSAPAHLGGYWATTEDGHASEVRAGENRGVTLHHDRVVRFYRPLEAWTTGAAAHELALDPSRLPSTPGHPRHVVLVVTDADTGRPVSALQLGC